MLKREEHDETQPGTQKTETPKAGEAAQVRVTTKELADAMASLQARKEAAARRMEGSIPIGEAIQELQLDATPEELLAEVQALRERPAESSHRRSRAGLAGRSAIALLVLVGGLWMVRGLRVAAPETPPAPTVSMPSLLTISAPAATLVQDNSGPTPVLRTLGEVQNERPVLSSLSQTEASVAFVNFSNPALTWTLIKHDGQIYVRGWMPNMSRQAMAAGDVEIFSHKADVVPGNAPIPVTLRLDRLRCLPGHGDDTAIVAHAVKPDTHFREAW